MMPLAFGTDIGTDLEPLKDSKTGLMVSGKTLALGLPLQTKTRSDLTHKNRTLFMDQIQKSNHLLFKCLLPSDTN